MALQKVAEEGEIPEESVLVVEVEGKEIGIFKVEENYYGVLNYCVHQSGPLCEGEIRSEITIRENEWMWDSTMEDNIIACPWHYWKFDIRTGKNVDSSEYKVPTFDVVTQNGDILVDV